MPGEPACRSGYEIDDPFPVPPIFGLIQELGAVSDGEMYEVFNMGCGFCCVVPADQTDAAVEMLVRDQPVAADIGCRKMPSDIIVPIPRHVMTMPAPTMIQP